MAIRSFALLASAAALVAAQDPSLKLRTYKDVLELKHEFDPVMAAYWTNLPHHRRTPFAVSPDGETGYLAYLDSSGKGVHMTHINPATMTWKSMLHAKGPVSLEKARLLTCGTDPDVTIPDVQEAGGLVAHDHGFALLGNEALASTVSNAPPSGTPVPAIYRYQWGEQQWKTYLGGPGVHEDEGLAMSPDMNGDLVWYADFLRAYTSAPTNTCRDQVRRSPDVRCLLRHNLL